MEKQDTDMDTDLDLSQTRMHQAALSCGLPKAMNNPQPGDEHISSFDAVDANWFVFDVSLKLALKSLCMKL